MIPRCGAVVLAAGASTRMGSPKPLLDIDGKRAISVVVDALRAAGCDRIVVVLGADASRIRGALPPDTTIVTNQDWPKGRSTSVRAGVDALAPDVDVCVWPVDHPLAAPDTVATLISTPGDVRVPVQGGRRGHPTVFAARLRPELLALRDDQPLHDVVHRDPGRVVEVPVEDEGIHANLDRPEDVSKALRRTPRGTT